VKIWLRVIKVRQVHVHYTCRFMARQFTCDGNRQYDSHHHYEAIRLGAVLWNDWSSSLIFHGILLWFGLEQMNVRI
jgi:hypothetical protein